jgi:ComF family protein
MPRSDYWIDNKNPLNQLFWGKTKIEFASAFLLFSKGSRYRKLIHSLKYKDDQESGIQLGKLYGLEIAKQSAYPKIDYIIPVPLHPKKQKKRGYNQSDCIAQGLSESINVPFLSDVLIRIVNTQTQTKKHKDERWENVSGVFDVQNIEQIHGKSILLVDDVITTGATIEHCAITLIEKADCKVSIACLARA